MNKVCDKQQKLERTGLKIYFRRGIDNIIVLRDGVRAVGEGEERQDKTRKGPVERKDAAVPPLLRRRALPVGGIVHVCARPGRTARVGRLGPGAVEGRGAQPWAPRACWSPCAAAPCDIAVRVCPADWPCPPAVPRHACRQVRKTRTSRASQTRSTIRTKSHQRIPTTTIRCAGSVCRVSLSQLAYRHWTAANRESISAEDGCATGTTRTMPTTTFSQVCSLLQPPSRPRCVSAAQRVLARQG